ncbi:hypothetical protein P9955_27380, partial [Serratia nevei]
VILVGLAIDQIAQSGLSSLSVIYYSAQLFSGGALMIQIIIEKCGDSPVFKIPEAIMEKVGFSIGDAIDIEVKNGCIIIVPAELVKYSLENLIEGISEVNLHNRVDFRLPIGKELL